MTNKEIDVYLNDWVLKMTEANDKEKQLLGCLISITALLAEIAKRISDVKND